MILAIIPARGGSKRIPRKNIKSFLGKPIISYSIKTAIDSKIFNDVMVSTDDEKIAKISKSFGASVPFMRSKKNSDDNAALSDAVREVLANYKKKGKLFDYFCCIYPTAPLIDSKILVKSFQILKNSDVDTVLPIVCYSHPIQRALKINEKGRLMMINQKNKNIKTQDLPKTYHDAGQFFFMKTSAFNKKETVFTDKVFGLEISETRVQDIDNLDDWYLAEMKYKFNHK